jgi:hypothetical protein
MTLHGIHGIVRKNLLISYRREYSAQALVSIHNKEPKGYLFEFSLELTPLGSSVIRVKLIDTPDFPSLSLVNLLKELVHKMDHDGDLP